MLKAFAADYNLPVFVSILGPRYTHGHVYDFYRKLSADPSRCPCWATGRQKKSYLHIDDCVDAILTATQKVDGKVNIFNLGTDEYCEDRRFHPLDLRGLGVQPKLEFGRRHAG